MKVDLHQQPNSAWSWNVVERGAEFVLEVDNIRVAMNQWEAGRLHEQLGDYLKTHRRLDL
jgi:hypothetical protein